MTMISHWLISGFPTERAPHRHRLHHTRPRECCVTALFVHRPTGSQLSSRRKLVCISLWCFPRCARRPTATTMMLKWLCISSYSYTFPVIQVVTNAALIEFEHLSPDRAPSQLRDNERNYLRGCCCCCIAIPHIWLSGTQQQSATAMNESKSVPFLQSSWLDQVVYWSRLKAGTICDQRY